jgi:hypothetical protein
MRNDTQAPERSTLRDQLVAMARDVGTVVTTTVALGATVAFITRPYTQPYLDLPKQLAEMQIQLASLQIELSEVREPHIVDFDGPALVIGEQEIVDGQTIKLLYNLRRNASCLTDVEVGYINVDDGTRIVTGTMRAVQAPVTEDYAPFLLRHRVSGLPPGTWSYQPRLTPVECGVYGPYMGALSEPFTVVENQ